MNIGLVDVDGHNFPNFATDAPFGLLQGKRTSGGMGVTGTAV